METTTAIKLIHSLRYFPGWTFEASDHVARFEGAITVRVTYPTRNANRDQVDNCYPQEISPYAVFPLVVRDLDDKSLYRCIADMIGEIWSHETREALRTVTGWAPFHPHRVDGMHSWNATDDVSDRARREVVTDLMFGLA